MQALAAEVIAELAPAALREDKRLALQGEAPSFPGQPLLLQVLLRNLLDNAVRHTPPGTEVLVSLEQKAGQSCLTVCDDGPGLNDTEREQLTRRFYRGTQAGNGGGGLGIDCAADCRVAWRPAGHSPW
ncbi:MAG: sensor histidine kinase [Thiolinea sp.]